MYLIIFVFSFDLELLSESEGAKHISVTMMGTAIGLS